MMTSYKEDGGRPKDHSDQRKDGPNGLSLHLVRRRSELAALVTELASLPADTPLAVDVARSCFEDELWLVSIEVEDSPPWLIDVQKSGGHDALAFELREVLEGHPICPLYRVNTHSRVTVTAVTKTGAKGVPADELIKLGNRFFVLKEPGPYSVTELAEGTLHRRPAAEGGPYIEVENLGKDPLEAYCEIYIRRGPFEEHFGRFFQQEEPLEWCPTRARELYAALRSGAAEIL